MMKAKLWDKSTNTYSDVEVPYGCSFYEENMGAIITCPSCGERLKFGDCHTSRKFYTLNGIFALSVCPACHEREWGR